MTSPRVIVAGATTAITRRTTLRKAFLGPWDPWVQQCWLYALADAQRHSGVAIHHGVLVVNHEHLTVTPSHDNLPEFVRRLHRDVSCAINTLLIAHRYDAPRDRAFAVLARSRQRGTPLWRATAPRPQASDTTGGALSASAGRSSRSFAAFVSIVRRRPRACARLRCLGLDDGIAVARVHSAPMFHPGARRDSMLFRLASEMLWRGTTRSCLVAGGVIAAIAGQAAHAHAFDIDAARNVMEVQVSASALADIIDQTVKVSTPCPSTSALGTLDKLVPSGLPTFSRGAERDIRVGIDPDTLQVTGAPIQVKVPFALGFKTDTILKDPAASVDQFSTTANVDARFELELKANSLCLKLVSATAVASQPTFNQAIASGFSSSITAQKNCVPLNLKVLDGLAGDQVPTARGVAFSNGRLAIRVEYGVPPDRKANWEDFFDGDFAPVSEEFGVFVDQSLLRAQAEAEIREGIADSDQVSLRSGPSSRWTTGATSAELRVTAGMEADGFLCENHASVGAKVKFSYENGELVVDTSTDVSWGDQGILRWAACGALWTEFASTALPGSQIFVIFGKTALELPKLMEAEADISAGKCEQISSTRRVCRLPIQIAFDVAKIVDAPRAKFAGTNVRGIAEGLVIGGKYSLASRFVPKRLNVTGSVSFGLHGSCGASFAGTSGMVLGVGGVLTATGTGRMCGKPTTHNDRDGIIALEAAPAGRLPDDVEMLLKGDLTRYRSTPYPLLVTVRTNAGSKTIQVSADTQWPSDTQMTAVITTLDTVRRMECTALVPVDLVALRPIGVIDPVPFIVLPRDLAVRFFFGNRYTSYVVVEPGLRFDALANVVVDPARFLQVMSQIAGRSLTQTAIQPLWNAQVSLMSQIASFGTVPR